MQLLTKEKRHDHIKIGRLLKVDTEKFKEFLKNIKYLTMSYFFIRKNECKNYRLGNKQKQNNLGYCGAYTV